MHGSTQAEHDKRVREVLDRLQANGLTVNPQKAMFNQKKVEFFGLVIRNDGVSLNELKTKALLYAEEPQTASVLNPIFTQSVRRFDIPNLERHGAGKQSPQSIKIHQNGTLGH